MTADDVLVVERRYRLSPRTCAVCGNEFKGWGRQRFCSAACRRRWDYQQHAEERRAKRRERQRRQKSEQPQKSVRTIPPDGGSHAERR